jgi:acyl-CoA hydrolase
MALQSLKAEDLLSFLPKDGLILVQGCSGESELLAQALRDLGDAVGAITVTGIFVPGLNRTLWLPNARSRVRTFFLTPELRRQQAQVEFLPLCYGDILTHLRTAKIAAALFQVSPPDAQGLCSFGPIVDFLAELWPQIPVRIAQINPSLPRVKGYKGIPFTELTACYEADTPLLGMPDDPPDAVANAIAAHIAGFVPDGATLQIGLGRIPGAVLHALRDHRHLRLHSGLVGDAVLGLAAAGALAPGAAITAGVAIGTPELYAATSSEIFQFQPVSYTHNPHILAAIPNLVTVNSALSIDLFGQSFAELTPRGLLSGPGGASDFARGAKAGGGLRIIALPAVAGNVSRIVPPGGGAGPVSLGRMDTDIIVTEYGAADLRGLTHDARAQALIRIAAPGEREVLSVSWREFSKTL